MVKILIAALLFFFMGNWGVAADIERVPPASVKQPYPTLIVVHDLWGMDNFVKREAEKYAELGFLVVGVDLYSGELPKDLPSAQRLKNNLDSSDSFKKIGKVYDRITHNKRIDKSRVGILGWGMGGGLALRYAVTNPQLRVAVMVYGDPLVEEAAFQKLKVNRLLAIFAENDQNIPLSKIEQFKKALSANHILSQVDVMKGARSGFLDSTRTENFNPKATEETRSLISGFLQKHLSLTEHRK